LEVPGVWVAREPAVYCIPTRSGPVQVACLPSLPPSRTAEGPLPAAAEAKARAGESLDAIVSQLAAELDPAVPAVLTAHVLVEGATLSSEANLMLGTEPMVSRAAIANPAFDYVALGHVHRFQDLNAGGRPPVVYAGSLDRIDFGEEKDEKGFVIAEIARGEARYEFVPVAARRFVTIRVAVEEGEATAPIAAAIARADTRDAVVRVIVTMREEAPLDERAVRAALGDAYLALPVERDIVNPRDQVRNPVLADRSLDPLAALDEYLKTRRFSEARRVLLREYAGRLLTDVERDEALDLERP
jgi:exonuclease SbcD